MNRSWRYLAFVTILAATFMSVLNTNMIRVASPSIMSEFGVDVKDLTWVFNAYILPYSILMPVFGRLGDMYGRKRMFMLGLTTFAAGSILCSMTWTFGSLVLFRVIQAVGAGALFPNAMAMGTALFPPDQRGRMLGVWGGTAAVGAVVGPALGGFLVDFLRWRAVFYVNVPVAVLALVGAATLLGESPKRPGRFDFAGSILLAAGLFSLVMGLTSVGDGRGLVTAGYLAIALLIIWAFCRVEKGLEQPTVDLNLFSNPVFVAGTVCGGVHMLTGQATTFLLPLFLAQVQGHPAAVIGLIMLPSACVRIFASPLGGALSDRLGNRWPVTAGLLIKILTFTLLAFLTPQASPAYIVAALLINGTGAGLIWSPTLSAVMGSAPPERAGTVAGVFNMLRFVAGICGTTVAGLVLSANFARIDPARRGPVPGYFESYVMLIAVCALALVFVRQLERTVQTQVPAQQAEAAGH
ncbi:MAG: MFS transporter [Bacillota bacterium]